MNKALCMMVGMIIVISSGGVVWAAQTDYAIGKTGAGELKLGLGARPAAMGEAFVGLANDLNATVWNPAGLAQVKNYQLGFMHSMYLQETSLENVSYAQSVFEGAGLGVSGMYFNYGKMDKVTFDSQIPEVVGSFTPSTMIGSVGYGQKLMDNVALGVTLKYYSQSIDSETYTTLAADLGALLQVGIKGLSLGVAMQNLGGKIAGCDLPMNLKTGAAYEIPLQVSSGDQWNFLCDVNVPFGDTQYVSVNLGTEYWYQGAVAARLGYKVKDSGDLGGITGLTAGLGAAFSIINLDYALVSYGDLGLVHQVAVSVKF